MPPHNARRLHPKSELVNALCQQYPPLGNILTYLSNLFMFNGLPLPGTNTEELATAPAMAEHHITPTTSLPSVELEKECKPFIILREPTSEVVPDDLLQEITALLKARYPHLEADRIIPQLNKLLTRLLKPPRRRGRPPEPHITRAIELRKQNTSWNKVLSAVSPILITDANRDDELEKLQHSVRARSRNRRKSKVTNQQIIREVNKLKPQFVVLASKPS